jgi:hypothetical protein
VLMSRRRDGEFRMEISSYLFLRREQHAESLLGEGIWHPRVSTLLTSCPECRAQISEYASVCPRCGYPDAGSRGREAVKQRDALSHQRKASSVGRIILRLPTPWRLVRDGESDREVRHRCKGERVDYIDIRVAEITAGVDTLASIRGHCVACGEQLDDLPVRDLGLDDYFRGEDVPPPDWMC